jgi:hypothetical protein
MDQTYEEGTVFVKVDYFAVKAVRGAADSKKKASSEEPAFVNVSAFKYSKMGGELY